ncbi:AbiH family protein [Staphylococcus pasteuri]|uniref:AbiH family protein n=1 Tax=Staphylococcus pasteuri TaxID=45972 RepID=UPI002DBD52CE|nr:AbiH family protein [Staphylococcus pasteuri]MEB7435267.1 bacteriophage abortive infection AbiH family protein [Staphylococcus pasteuri]
MNITFLIGNGFDIQKGLKTRYIDFYNYMNDENKLSEKNMFFKAILDFISESNNIDGDRNDPKDIDWSDFEKALGLFTEQIKSRKDAEKYLNDLIEFREEFLNYLKNEETKLKVEGTQAQEQFSKLVKHFYEGIGDKNETTIKNFMTDNGFFNFYFINFNYTNTLSMIVENIHDLHDEEWDLFKVNKPIYVHRDIDSGAFLGVNDRSQIINKEVFDDEEFADLIKPEMQEAEFSEIPEQVQRILDETSIFFIYGMSLGETDKIWWQQIGNILKQNNNRYLIINRYINEDERPKINRHLSIKRNLRNQTVKGFLNHLDFNDEEKEILKQRIFVVIGSKNIFTN